MPIGAPSGLEPTPAGNRLVRPWSRLERVGAAILIGILIVGLGAAAVVGSRAYAAGRALERAAAGRVQVTAVIVAAAPASSDAPEPANSPAPGRQRVRIRWIDPTGVERTAMAMTSPGSSPGSRLAVWTDGQGGLVAAPTAWVAPAARAVGASVLVLVATGAALYGGSLIVRQLERRRRLAAWGRDWARLADGSDGDGL